MRMACSFEAGRAVFSKRKQRKCKNYVQVLY